MDKVIKPANWMGGGVKIEFHIEKRVPRCLKMLRNTFLRYKNKIFQLKTIKIIFFCPR